MAGCDYAGLAINFVTKKWTNMGYINDGKETISFHKALDPNCKKLVEPAENALSQTPGIARYKDWWMVWGYTDVDQGEFLREYLKANKKDRELALFNQIVSKKKHWLH